MSDHIPFDIQSEIMKRIPVKSLIQFRSVSKQWKSLIDSPRFIKNYHVNLTTPQHHLLVRYKLDTVRTYTSIIDNNTFPQQKYPLTAPEHLSFLRHAIALGSVSGLLCFYGIYKDVHSDTRMAVIWNPSVKKSVKISDIEISDPKLVKISDIETPTLPSMWVVEVFTLSTCIWKTVYMGAPIKSCQMVWNQVFVDGIIYWRALDDIDLDEGFRSNYIISFDLKMEKLGEVSLPKKLVRTYSLVVEKVNESLSLLEYYDEGEMSVCGVWARKDGENKPFTKIYTVKVEGKSVVFPRVLGSRKNGEVILEVVDDKQSEIEVYEPSSGHINGVGINGNRYTFSTRSYMETLLLLNESNSIVIDNDDSTILQSVDSKLQSSHQVFIIQFTLCY